MRVTKIETVRLSEHPRLVWVQVHTDEGITGTGESYDKAGVIARAVHDVHADILLGQDPTRIEYLWDRMFSVCNYHGYAGAEFRAASALDLALWDIVGKIAGQPLYRILGGATRDRLRLYNTCISWGSYRDRERFLSEPGPLAQELLAEGITGIKVWPFDAYSAPTLGQEISREGLKFGVGVVAAIREAVGDAMDIAVEMHACWNLPSAIRIARALEPYDVMWIEEPMIPDNVEAYKALRAATRVPICESERLFTRFGFRAMIESGALDVVMPDIVWTGGITEMRKIASHAATYLLPLAPHNAGGPITHLANVHVAATLPNFKILESVRAFYRGWFPDVVDAPPVVEAGHALLPEGPGLGANLLPDVRERPDAEIEASEAGHGLIFAATGDPWASSPGDPTQPET